MTFCWLQAVLYNVNNEFEFKGEAWKNWVIKAPTGLEPVPPSRTLLPTKLRSHTSQFFSASIFSDFFNLYILIWKLKLFKYSFIQRTEIWLISVCDFCNNFDVLPSKCLTYLPPAQFHLWFWGFIFLIMSFYLRSLFLEKCF